jgi:hypothetical protein
MNSNKFFSERYKINLYQHPEWKHLYASIDGRIFRRSFSDFYEKSSYNDGNGYLRTKIQSGIFRGVSRIVWSCFYNTKIPEDFVIDHFDSNTKNNHISNLECISRAENTRRGTKYSLWSKKKEIKKSDLLEDYKYPFSTIL